MPPTYLQRTSHIPPSYLSHTSHLPLTYLTLIPHIYLPLTPHTHTHTHFPFTYLLHTTIYSHPHASPVTPLTSRVLTLQPLIPPPPRSPRSVPQARRARAPRPVLRPLARRPAAPDEARVHPGEAAGGGGVAAGDLPRRRGVPRAARGVEQITQVGQAGACGGRLLNVQLCLLRSRLCGYLSLPRLPMHLSICLFIS